MHRRSHFGWRSSRTSKRFVDRELADHALDGVSLLVAIQEFGAGERILCQSSTRRAKSYTACGNFCYRDHILGGSAPFQHLRWKYWQRLLAHFTDSSVPHSDCRSDCHGGLLVSDTQRYLWVRDDVFDGCFRVVSSLGRWHEASGKYAKRPNHKLNNWCFGW